MLAQSLGNFYVFLRKDLIVNILVWGAMGSLLGHFALVGKQL